MHETEAEVLARIDATRARMSETIEQIGDRVNPERVQEELKSRARDQVREVKENVKDRARSAMRDIEHGVNDAGRGIWDAIRENPIPAGMVGVGLAWLVANSATSHGRRESVYRAYPEGLGYAGYVGTAELYADRDYGYGSRGYGAGMHGAREYEVEAFAAADRAGLERDIGRHESDEGMKAKAREAAGEVKERASEAMDATREKASEIGDRASELGHRASERMHEAQDRASQAARNVGYRARSAERRVEHAVQDNPLAAGAIAAALGFAAGMMIPETRREHEMFGHARDRMIENAERTVRRAGQKARDVARETASESARRAVDEVLPGGEGRERERVSEPGR